MAPATLHVMDWPRRIFDGIRSRGSSPERLLDLVRRLRPEPCGFPLVRIGPKRDGGYLVPDDLDGIEACFSPGVGRTFAFEADLLARGIPSHLADASVPKPPDLPDGLTFDPVFLGARTADGLVTLDEWVGKLRPGARGDLLLQMDIEGSEYTVLPSLDPATLARFRIVIVEFHQLPLLADPFICRILSPAFEVLLEQFVPVHLHPNNVRRSKRFGELEVPRTMEFTFLRRDRVRPGGPAPTFPHPLDADCVEDRPTITLPAAWRPGSKI